MFLGRVSSEYLTEYSVGCPIGEDVDVISCVWLPLSDVVPVSEPDEFNHFTIAISSLKSDGFFTSSLLAYVVCLCSPALQTLSFDAEKAWL